MKNEAALKKANVKNSYLKILPVITFIILYANMICFQIPAIASDISAEIDESKLMKIVENIDCSEYIIGSGDFIKVFVYENPEYTDNYRVGPDGKISMPIIGTISAAGMTREKLSSEIKKQLLRYLSNPIVTVIVNEYNNNFIHVLGEIEKPGRYDFKGEMTLLSILPQIGVNESLKKGGLKCDIIRNSNVVFTVDLADYQNVLQNRLLMNLKLANNDLLYFTSNDNLSGRIYILGHVKNPGLFSMEKGEDLKSVLKSKIDLLPAASNIVKVIRRMQKRTLQFEYNLNRPAYSNPKIEPGDIIYVQQRNDKNFSYFIKDLAPYVAVGFIGNEAVKYIKDK